MAEVGAVAGDQEIGAGRDRGGEDRRVTVLKIVTGGRLDHPGAGLRNLFHPFQESIDSLRPPR